MAGLTTPITVTGFSGTPQSARVKNADGSAVSSPVYTDCVYDNSSGKWICANDAPAGTYPAAAQRFRLPGTSPEVAALSQTSGVVVSGNTGNTTPLAAPTGLAATPTSPTAAGVSWNARQGAAGYALQRAPVTNGTAGTYATVYQGTATSYVDAALSASSTYAWKVLAKGDGTATSDSPYSSPVQATTQAAGQTTVAPTVRYTASTRRLTATHPQNGTILVSYQGGTYTAYTGGIAVDSEEHLPNEWLFKRQAGNGYQESPTAGNQRIAPAPVPTTPGIASFSPDSGLPGTAFVIKGLAFGASQGQGKAYINDVEVKNYTSWADGRIEALVPNGGPGRVKVVTDGGTVYVSENYFLVKSDDAFQLTQGVFGQRGGILKQFGFILPDAPFSTTNDYNGAGSYAFNAVTGSDAESPLLVTPFAFVATSLGVAVPILQRYSSGLNVLRVGIYLGDPTSSNVEYVLAELNFANLGITLFQRNNADPGKKRAFATSSLPQAPTHFGLGYESENITVWVKYGADQEWQVAFAYYTNHDYNFELWRPTEVARISGGCCQVVGGSNAASNKFIVGPMQVGYLQGVSAANWKAVTDLDGNYYQDGTSIALTGSIAHVSARNTDAENIASACGIVVELNVDTNTYIVKTLLWNVRKWKYYDGTFVDRIYPDNAYAIQKDSRAGKSVIDAGRWAGIGRGEAHMGVQTFTVDTFPVGPVVLTNGVELPFVLPDAADSTYGYDTCRLYADANTYTMAYCWAQANGQRGIYRVTSTTPTGTQQLVAQATALQSPAVKEGTNAVRINGTTNYLVTNDGQACLVLDEALNQVGTMSRTDTGQSVNPTHPCFFVLGGGGSAGRPFWMAYDGTTYQGRNYTAGNGRLLESASNIPVYNGVMLGLPY